jgi:hypothetical protein
MVLKGIGIFLIGVLIFSCKSNDTEVADLKSRILDLEEQLNTTYKPGYGSIMLNMQSRHAKLWFAGNNQNWDLAAFALEEIEEAVADIKKYQSDKEETKVIDMINPAIAAVKESIEARNATGFDTNFEGLTAVCNACHTATKHSFIIIKTPLEPIFPNQDFTVRQELTIRKTE